MKSTFSNGCASSETDLVLGIALRETEDVNRHDRPAPHRRAAIATRRSASASARNSTGAKVTAREATGLIIRHAFQTLNFNRLWLHVFEYNARGIRVYEKLGFRIEGRLRQDTFREGRYWDTLVMGVLREELESVDY